MATGANLTIMGLYNYNENIFDGFNVPSGMNKETAINEILLECAEMELIYPSFNTMKIAITNWSAIEQPIWTRLYNTETIEYNPLWNVDGDVVETRSVERGKTGSNSQSLDGTDTTNAETNVQNPGYNSNDLVLTEKQTANETLSRDQSITGEDSENETVDESVHTRRTGNIGVTSSQQLLREERDVADFSTYKFIVNSFKKRFCLLVY